MLCIVLILSNKCNFPMSNNDVEYILMKETDFHLLDFPNENYMENFERNISPRYMAEIIIYKISKL